ncbi:MAG: CPBP family intramembrane metalloprotease [Promethearchaeota archaeon]|nr:MAG: CPBP family intramembrane metalloprotease [Candidatus Lokiarchaeota archaeon]
MSNQDLNNNIENIGSKWRFCPYCGKEFLHNADNITFCPYCGSNLKALKQKGTIGKITRTEYKSSEKKLTEEEISKNVKKPLWENPPAILFPLLAFTIMQGIVTAITFLLVFFAIGMPDIEIIENFLNSTTFLILASFTELIFIIIPLISAGSYLKKPSLRNRFGILGIPINNRSKVKIIKEIVLGLAFAVVAFFMVNFISLFLEFIVNLFPNVSVDSSSQIDPTGSANLIEIILLVIVMLAIVGPSEEIAFRGYMQKGLVRNVGDKAGLFITALIFTGMHLPATFILILISPISFIINLILMFFPYFAISILLGYLFHTRNENLTAPITLHGVYNSITVIFGFLFYNGTYKALSTYILIIILLMIISFISYYILKYIEKGK